MEFLEIIFSLENKSKDIANTLSIIQKEINEGLPDTPEEAVKFQSSLRVLCQNLTNIIKLLEYENSPLYQLKARLGPTCSLIEESGVSIFTYEQELLLKRIGLDTKNIEKAISYNKNDKELIAQANSFEVSEVLHNIRHYRDLVCGISNNLDIVYATVRGEPITTIVEGAIGVCVVVVDVTGAFTVPDPTAFTFIKSMKSTIIGSKKVMNSIVSIKNFISENRWERIVKSLPRHHLRHRRDNDGE